MAAVPLVLALLVLAITTVSFIVAAFASWKVRVGRHLKHDLATALTTVRLAVYRGRTKDAEEHLETISAYLHPGQIARVKLRRFVRAVVSLVGRAYDGAITYDDDGDVVVVTYPADLHRAILNALINAAEAQLSHGGDEPVQVSLSSSCIRISNRATFRDRCTVLRDAGTTRGHGRGSGRGSIERSCARLGWSVEYAIEDSCVITTLRFHEAPCYDELCGDLLNDQPTATA